MTPIVLELDTIQPFGKHVNQEVEDVLEDYPDYLVWMYEEWQESCDTSSTS